MNSTRPKEYDLPVVKATVDLILAGFVSWCGNAGEDPEDVRQDLEEMLKSSSYPDDGYRNAKYLEDYRHWYPDSQLVEMIDNIPLGSVHDKFVKQWVKDNNITLDIPIGSIVDFKNNKNPGSVIWTVSKYFPEDAKYGLQNELMPKTSHRIACSEEVILVSLPTESVPDPTGNSLAEPAD